ncbi:MAG: translation initiation factor IF-2 [Cyclonatronaceae bacterium]
MTVAGKPKRLFKVASEFNVSTQSIVDSLNDNGFPVENKPNVKITPEMYSTLEAVYGEDKARSRDHVRAREEYEERRSTFHSSRNESVTIDSFLDPIEELKPKDEAAEDELLPLEPIDADQLDKEKKEQKRLADDKEAKKKEEPEEKAGASEKEKTGGKDDVEPAAESKPESGEELEEADTGAGAEGMQETDTEPAEAGPADEVPETDRAGDTETPEDVEEAEYDEEQPDDEILDSPIIRGRKEKLAGTRVLGKIEIADPAEKAPGKKKKKKGKKAQKEEKPADAPSLEPEDADKPKKKKIAAKRVREGAPEAGKGEDVAKPRKKKKRIKSRKAPKVEESDVESKMKETLAMLSTGGAAGRKRQKRRKQKREEMAAEREFIQSEKSEKQQRTLEVTEFITVSDLADLLDVSPNEIIMHCMNLGMVVSINQRLEASTIELLADQYDRDVMFVDAEELSEDLDEGEEDEPEELEPRSPVVTVMGHVDHGKTSLLDYIRKTKVTAGEAGGITQHIGAYEVRLPDKRNITFLDTPGHEAFTAMRARGAQVTDMVILVIAADDAVMPQTVEAINHAQAGGVPMVVAINKTDKEGANPDRIKQQLSDYNVIVEEWGGNVQIAEVSAHTGKGIDELLDKVLIEAELMELKANPNRRASGIVLEAKVDRGKGVVANILIQRGTLRIGDPFVAGSYSGKVRALENEFGERIDDVGPAQPAQMTGFDGIPQAGDKIVAVEDERIAKDIAHQRQQIKREQSLRKVKHVTLDDISRRLALGEMAELNIIIKGDVDGSIEALAGSLQKLSNEEVKVNIIHTGVGAISESDVLLASASEAIIIGFQVRPSANARRLAENEEIDIRLFSVIYDAVDAVRDALEGLLSPEVNEKTVATLEVLDIFKVPKAGTIAGCKVTDGKITRNTRVRLIRDGIVIYEGELASLKRFKDDVKEVASGYECGLGIKNYNDIKVGDVIEGYEVVETKRKLKQETSG